MIKETGDGYNPEYVENINSILLGYDDYKNIQGKPELDDLILAYINGVKDKINKPYQIDFVIQSTKKNDIQSRAAVFHEKQEVQWLLDNGFSVADIKSGKAHHEKYNEAHHFASEAQYKLYQFVSEKEYGYKIPSTIFVITEPYGENDALIWYFILCDHPDILKIEDVEKSMLMFEKFGSSYKNREKMKEKCETFIKNCEEKITKKY
ncbi:MAG: hypothetical protein V1732_01765 [Patescibacteria group bacterium]